MGRKKVLAGIAVAFVAVAVPPPPAQADVSDYVSELDNSGIYYASITGIIDLGKQICSVGRRAPIGGPVMTRLLANLMESAGYTSDWEQAVIATSAANYMCPDVIPRWRADHAAVPQG